MTTSHGLDFGPLDLVSEAHGTGGDYSFNVIGEDLQFGSPQPVEVSIASLMADGSPTNTTRWDNREAGFQVVITASDSLALADGEAALAAVIGTRTTLAWTPPDGIGPTSVFEVETSSMEFLFSDLDEMQRMQRTYRLRLVCLPWVRSANPTTVGSAFVANSATISDECESTSGWSATTYTTSYGTFTVDTTAGNFVSGAGAIKHQMPVTAAGGGQTTAQQTIKKSGLSIDGSGGGYLVMSIKTQWPTLTVYGGATITTSGGGAQSVTGTIATAQANGYVRYAWAIPHPSTVTSIEFTLSQGISREGQSSPYVWFDAIGLSAAATNNQQSRTFDIGGSARSEGSIEIAAPLGLGDVVLYTAPDRGDGFAPDLRRWFTTGSGTTSDSNAINGSYIGLGSATMEAPASMFRPGAYAVLARVKSPSATAVALTVTATTVLSGTTIGVTNTCASPVISLPNSSNYFVVCAGSIDLPPTVVDKASGAKIRFQITAPGYAGTQFDELMVFPLEDAALTWVSCGSGTPSATVASRLWVDAPSPTQPRGALLVGNAADRSDARAIVPKSRGRHLLYPGSMFEYLLTSAAGGASSVVTYWKHWHSNAGE